MSGDLLLSRRREAGRRGRLTEAGESGADYGPDGSGEVRDAGEGVPVKGASAGGSGNPPAGELCIG